MPSQCPRPTCVTTRASRVRNYLPRPVLLKIHSRCRHEVGASTGFLTRDLLGREGRCNGRSSVERITGNIGMFGEYIKLTKATVYPYTTCRDVLAEGHWSSEEWVPPDRLPRIRPLCMQVPGRLCPGRLNAIRDGGLSLLCNEVSALEASPISSE